MIRDERIRTVQSGYDALGACFGEWMERIEGDPWERFVDHLVERLPAGACVLDLGCGDGEKTKRLAERFDVVGVDISEEELRLARARPRSDVRPRRLRGTGPPGRSFHAFTAFYSFMHVPRGTHATLLSTIARWLKPGGLFAASLSHVGGDDRIETWLGVEMFFSGFDAETNRRIVREAGFDPLVDELVWMREPKGEFAFLWVLARTSGMAPCGG